MERSSKFWALREIGPQDVDLPDYVYVTYSVCDKSCGWRGWLLEGVFKETGKIEASGTGDLVLPALTGQTCPNCGASLFRTIVSERCVAERNSK